jgi:hypothetical protein
LIADNKLLLVAVCAFNHWSLADITSTYRPTQAEGLKRLLLLDRMGVIALMPGDRIRPRVARDFDWRPGGPIRQMFIAQGPADFLAGQPQQPCKQLSRHRHRSSPRNILTRPSASNSKCISRVTLPNATRNTGLSGFCRPCGPTASTVRKGPRRRAVFSISER